MRLHLSTKVNYGKIPYSNLLKSNLESRDAIASKNYNLGQEKLAV